MMSFLSSISGEKAMMQFLSSIQREIISQSEILGNKVFYNFSNVKANQGISNPTD